MEQNVFVSARAATQPAPHCAVHIPQKNRQAFSKREGMQPLQIKAKGKTHIHFFTANNQNLFPPGGAHRRLQSVVRADHRNISKNTIKAIFSPTVETISPFTRLSASSNPHRHRWVYYFVQDVHLRISLFRSMKEMEWQHIAIRLTNAHY